MEAKEQLKEFNIWKVISGAFSPIEAWGEPLKVNGLLLMALVAIRAGFRSLDPTCAFQIHCAVEGEGHVSDSQHPSGNAVDFHIKTTLTFTDQVIAMQVILAKLQIHDRVGLGIYPDWNTPGFHLDVRGTRSRWGRIGEKYVSLDEAYIYTTNAPKKEEAK